MGIFALLQARRDRACLRILQVLAEDETIGGIKGMVLREKAGVSRGSFYSLMLMLETEGLVTHTVGVPETRRGNRPAFFYSIEPTGRKALEELKRKYGNNS